MLLCLISNKSRATLRKSVWYLGKCLRSSLLGRAFLNASWVFSTELLSWIAKRQSESTNLSYFSATLLWTNSSILLIICCLLSEHLLQNSSKCFWASSEIWFDLMKSKILALHLISSTTSCFKVCFKSAIARRFKYKWSWVLMKTEYTPSRASALSSSKTYLWQLGRSQLLKLIFKLQIVSQIRWSKKTETLRKSIPTTWGAFCWVYRASKAVRLLLLRAQSRLLPSILGHEFHSTPNWKTWGILNAFFQWIQTQISLLNFGLSILRLSLLHGAVQT